MTLTPTMPSGVDSLTDPWWANHVTREGLRELIYKHWAVDLGRIEPGMLEDRLPADVDVLHRSTFHMAQKQNVALRIGEAVALVELFRDRLWVSVAEAELGEAQRAFERVQAIFPEHGPEAGRRAVKVTLWTASEHGPRARYRTIDVPDWPETRLNYAAKTQVGLERMMMGFTPGDGGRLILWHGPPGTGKTFAIRALAWEWREWCDLHYVLDPDALLVHQPGYLFELALGMEEALGRKQEEPRWRLVVLEDTGELLVPDAKREVGQGLSRLLNLTDGILGQGLRVLVLVTSNEPLDKLHPAVARPGRCAARIEFAGLAPPEARRWLLDRGTSDVDDLPSGSATLAELFALADGREAQLREPVGFAAPR